MIDLLNASKFTIDEIEIILGNRNFKEQIQLQKDILLKQIIKNESMLRLFENISHNDQPNENECIQSYLSPFFYIKNYAF